MTLDQSDQRLVRDALRDALGHAAGVSIEDVPKLETALAANGLAIVRVDARVTQPGEPGHPSTRIAELLDDDVPGGAAPV